MNRNISCLPANFITRAKAHILINILSERQESKPVIRHFPAPAVNIKQVFPQPVDGGNNLTAIIDKVLSDQDDSFIKTRPLMIRAAARSRKGVTDSPNTKMPTINAPIAPIPVQIV